ncbi:K(+)-transporting ATPase subunit F [Nostoc sp. CENA543]|uniref:K(+)-transporting ATPase subunit F n=1 Tax=Nostoc sp. CENA543 TaxID=1869241 RepID=UPI000CA1C112|nr:K(+)-transporting ATPase subunit F [Nostoc sp. CENA543]AUS99942.1 K(+)-transporting ATPase subunit F [Nostoc sp. CENA543]
MSSPNLLELFNFLRIKRYRFPVSLFVLLCVDVLLASEVQAATTIQLSRTASYAIATLGIVTLSLCIYLFVVIFQPERF